MESGKKSIRFRSRIQQAREEAGGESGLREDWLRRNVVS